MYDETAAFLSLVQALLPQLVASSTLNVYLAFIIDSIFHRFVTRTYSKPDQKW